MVEISVVLVILGLLVGGILAGQSLIRAAEIRALSSSAQTYRAALYAFRDKYLAIPGDMTNATAFWGTLAGSGSDATCQNTEATGAATCNGNGDGFIDGSGSVTSSERFRFWQHLANAGLAEGRYTGRTDSSTSGSYVLTAGKNVPQVRGNAMVDPYTFNSGDVTSTTGVFLFSGAAVPGRHMLAYRTVSNTAALVTPEELWNIDTKLDDGRPATGIVLGPQQSWSASTNCTTSDTPTSATYNLALRDKICRFHVRLD